MASFIIVFIRRGRVRFDGTRLRIEDRSAVFTVDAVRGELHPPGVRRFVAAGAFAKATAFW